MSKKIITAAFVALIGVPFAAHAQEGPERGVSVVPIANEAGNSGGFETFVVRPPVGVQPEAGGGNSGGVVNIVRPPEGVPPGGGNGGAGNAGGGNGGGGNAGGGATQQIVIQPQGTKPNRPDNQVVQVLPRNDVINVAPPRRQSPVVQQQVFAPVEQIVPANAERLTITGVESGTDLYKMLTKGGYKVTVKHGDTPGHYVLLARAPHQAYAHYLLVNDHDGAVLKHKTVKLGQLGYQSARHHQPAQSYGHRKYVEACDTPRHTRQVAYGYGHGRRSHY